MAASKYLGANLDVGHYTEAGYDPILFLQKHHDRITNLHLKDMKKATNGEHRVRGSGGSQGRSPEVPGVHERGVSMSTTILLFALLAQAASTAGSVQTPVASPTYPTRAPQTVAPKPPGEDWLTLFNRLLGNDTGEASLAAVGETP